MNIIIKIKNLELTDPLEKFINNKIGRLKKFLHENNQEIFVEIEKETNHHKKGDIFRAEAIIHLPGKSLMAKSHGENLSGAIIDVKEELEREIRKYKTKTIELPRRKYRKSLRQADR